MVSSRKIRRLGWMAMTAGWFLVVMVACVALWIRFSDVIWEGTPAYAAYAITVGVLIVALGVVGISAGLWMIKHGKRNQVLTYAIMGLGWALVILVVVHQLTEKS